MKALLDLFFPKVCLACNSYISDNEEFVCTDCRHQLPVTNFHFNKDTTIIKNLYGRVQLHQATALLKFTKKGLVQQLLHNLKYRGHEEVGLFLGKWLGAELRSIPSYLDVDVVVPVPLHASKYRKRGYNQVSLFGKEIAKAIQADYNSSVLKKTKLTDTQVFKNRLKRWYNTETIFTITEDENLKGKHLLLVDDIVTTGATIEACAFALNKIEGITLSVATMAIA